MLLAVCAAWLSLGIYGVIAYGHDYWTYRGFAPPRDPPGTTTGRLVGVRFWSAAMHQQRSYLIYLPPGYARDVAHGQRFPVLYLLHGSPPGDNLFINAAGVGVQLDRLVNLRRVRPFLIVMPDGGNGTFMSDTEWADTPHGRYESLVLDVVRNVDARWATVPDRSGRALAGNSEGAYAAVNIGLRHLALFSVAEAWSGYFTQWAGDGPFVGAARRLVARNDPRAYVPLLAPALRAQPFHAYIYDGRSEPSRRANAAFAREFHRYGGQVTYRVFPGGHSWMLWRRETPAMLLWAGREMGSAR